MFAPKSEKGSTLKGKNLGAVLSFQSRPLFRKETDWKLQELSPFSRMTEYLPSVSFTVKRYHTGYLQDSGSAP